MNTLVSFWTEMMLKNAIQTNSTISTERLPAPTMISRATRPWGCAAIGWALTGWAVCLFFMGLAPQVHAQDRVASSIDALGDLYDLQNKGVSASQSRIIFYRPSQAKQAGATTVYVNGRYHASLVPGGYSPICVKPGPVSLGLRHMDVNRRANKDGLDITTELNLAQGKNHIVRISDENRTPSLTVVKATDAQKELQDTRLQIHTISRVADATDCVDVAATASEEKPNAAYVSARGVRQMQLSGDTLFAFGRGDAAGLTSQGRRAMEQMMTQINAEFVQISRVHVVGHTDPFGSEAANERLAQQRAKTVAGYLARRDQFKGRVTSGSRGSRELLVTHCGLELTPQNVDCNQPNRRVSVEIMGTAR